MSITEEMGRPEAAGPLRDGLLVMDVADTLRRSPPGDGDAVAELRRLYAAVGIDAPESELREGLAALADHRFDYAPPRGAAAVLARLYVERRRWLPPVFAVALALTIGLGGYYLVYKPYRMSQAEQAELDLAKRLPAQMDALYQTIFEETKVQQAVVAAGELRARGKQAAGAGDRAGAEAAIARLTDLRDTLQSDYTLRVVDRPGLKWGFWRFPEDNSAATEYYIVVEARDAAGAALTLPVKSQQTGRTDDVSMWALQVPEDVYRAVEADKADDGIIQHNLVGAKSFGFLDPEYTVGILGGALTRW